MTSARRPRPLPTNSFAQLARGATYVFEALHFISKERLWRLAAAAIVVNVLLLAGLVAGSLVFALPRLEELQSTLVGLGARSGLLYGLMVLVGWLVLVLAVALIVAVNALVLVLVGQAIASPFLDLLSERVEELVLGRAPYPLSVKRVVVSVVMSIKDLVAGVLLLVLVNAPVFLVSLIPVVGTVPAAIVSFCFSAWLLAHEFVGLSLVRHLASYSARWGVIRRSKLLSLGFGSAAMGLLVVPGLNLILLPLAAVGGTLLYCDLEAAGRAQPVGPARQALSPGLS